MVGAIPIAPFEGRPVVVVAGAPSLTLRQVRAVGMARAQDLCRVIAVNDAVYPCWFADILHACDARWWERHAGVPHYRGCKLSLEPSFPDVRVLKNTGVDGYDPSPGCARSGANSAYQAVHVAAALGAKTIIIVAVDYTGDKNLNNGSIEHWFGRHGHGLDRNSNTQELRRLFRGLADILSGRGVTILNASSASTLKFLPQIDVENFDWAAHCSEPATDE